MTIREIAKHSMYKKIDTFLTSKKENFTGYPRLLTEIVTFSGLLPLLTAQFNLQSATTTGITVDKEKLFTKLIASTVTIARKALVYARDKNNETLIAVLNVTKSSFTGINRPLSVARLDEIIGNLDGIKSVLADYKVTATNISNLTTQFEAYEKAEKAPSTAAGSKKTATDTIKKLIAKLDSSINTLDELIINEYSETDAALVTEYKTNRRIETTGVRYTGIAATITDAATGLPVNHAILSIPALTKTAKADNKGKAFIKSMRNGSYVFDFIAAGYTTLSKTIIIEKGKTLEVGIKLVK